LGIENIPMAESGAVGGKDKGFWWQINHLP
jgi:hypothetical protein